MIHSLEDPAAVVSMILRDDDAALRVLSVVIGWSYFAAWTISFYPQVILNYRRQYVGGLSIDFTVLNVLGHSSYAIYNLAFFFNDNVQDEYKRRHNGHRNSVQPNDVAFSVHAALITLFTVAQTFYYPRSRGQRLSTFNRILVSAYALIILANVFGVFVIEREHLIDMMYVLSYFKIYVSIAKYVPQAYDNFVRKSTVGWSIDNILLDFTGGGLSLAQLFLDAARQDDWSSVTGNPAKLGLSCLSMLFDILFMIQHYVLYKDHTDTFRSGTSSPFPAPKSGLGGLGGGASPNLTPREIEAGEPGEESPLLGAQRS